MYFIKNKIFQLLTIFVLIILVVLIIVINTNEGRISDFESFLIAFLLILGMPIWVLGFVGSPIKYAWILIPLLIFYACLWQILGKKNRIKWWIILPILIPYGWLAILLLKKKQTEISKKEIGQADSNKKIE
jgi:hypothetical protein